MTTTTMPIKITADNAAAIEQALAAVNGKAKEHTFTSAIEIATLAQQAEAKLTELGIAKARRIDAVFFATSGAPVANAYKNKRIGTTVSIERRSAGYWYLTGINQTKLYKEGGKSLLELTKAQDEEAVTSLRKNYGIQAVAYCSKLARQHAGTEET